MTKDEILAMNVGSGMDILIAEKVMKWKERVDFDYVDGIIARYVPVTMDVVKFEPSTDIAAAWMVIDKLRKTHRIDLLLEEGVNYCSIMEYGDDACMYETGADATPEAICKAALLALE